MVDYGKISLQKHLETGGKWEIKSKFELKNQDDLAEFRL